MTPERWQKIEELYHSAQEREPGSRAAFLADSCGDDAELRQEVESLLAQDASREGTLDRPAWENANSLLDATRTQLASGAQLGPYRIQNKIGEGGMGAVYRAHDSRLGRDVAIKVAASQFTGRFEREARAVAALNHPNICTLHDVGPNFLVMELLDGETLAARLKSGKTKGKLSIEDTVKYGAQIADALAAAHAKGIIHRDLKPGNIMLTKNSVKVLDFGLAKSAQAETMTGTNVIMGTPAYMAPEQREGKETDARTDIYALGLVLYEMATGNRPAVRTNDVQSSEPLAGIPQPLGPVIERCLEAEPSNRWQSAADVKAILELSGTRPSAGTSALPPKRTSLKIAVVAACIALAGAVVWTQLRDRSAVPVAAMNVSLLPPPDTSFRFARNGEGGFAISPNGAMLAFVGRTQGKAQLWVRRLGETESRLLAGSEGAYNPFWSPDSRWIAFFTPQKLKKIEVANGAVVDLCDVTPMVSAGTWGAHHVILWGVPKGLTYGIQRLPDAGGSPVPVPGTKGAWDPHFLPDGRRFVYNGRYQSQDLWLASLDPDEKPRRIGEAGERPTYSAGHLLGVVNGILMARPFDTVRGELTGVSFALRAPLAHRVHWGFLITDFSANTAGTLVYPPETNSLTELRWRDRTGKLLGSLGAPGEYYTPRISPDGQRVAFTRRDGNNSDIWVAQPATNSLTRLTFDPGIDDNPVWSPDGAAVMFANDAEGALNLYRKAATGAGTIERLTTNRFPQQPVDWSRDGRFLLFTQLSSSTEVIVQSANGGQPLNFLGHAGGAGKPQFNPGVPHWITYDFDDSGRREIYVQAFEPGKPASSARWQISSAGGQMARWRGDGKEIFYLTLDGKLMAARVSGEGPAFQSSTPELLFNATPPSLRNPYFEYDVAPDGRRFLMIEPLEKPEYQPLTLVSNWLAK